MEDTFDEIVWSPQSERDLDDILEYYQGISPDTAYERVTNIILKTEDILFSRQYQIDEYDPSSRRLFVQKKFRVIYQVVDRIILITRVYPTKKDPEGILGK